MRKLIILIMAVVVAGAAALYFQRQASQSKAQNTTLAADEKASAERERQIRELEAEKQRADQEKQNLLRLTEEMGAQIQAQNQALTNKASAVAQSGSDLGKGGGGLGKMMASMMKDPEGKRFIREQQRLVMDPLYAPLLKQLGLTPEQSEQFRNLVLDNAMNAAEKATGMFGAGAGAERDESMKAIAADQKAFEEQVRALLGEGGYAQYKEYSTTLQERAQLNMFRQQMAGEEKPITDQQAEQLLAFMREEKQNPNNGVPEALRSGSQDPEAMKAFLDESQAARLLEVQATLNARVQERAGEVLAPNQLAAFARFQTNQLSMMQMGLKMARTMFGEGASAPAGTPPR